MRSNSALAFIQLLLLCALAESRTVSKNNVKRQTLLLLGGAKEQDASNPVYKDLAKESLELYVKQAGLTASHEVVNVTKVTTQVVSGSITTIDFNALIGPSVTSCRSKIYEKAWLNVRQVNVTCDDLNQKPKKQTSIPGGVNEQDVNDPIYTELAKESLKKYLAESGLSNTGPDWLVKIIQATKQVVAGYLTKIEFDAKLGSTNTMLSCKSTILEQAWLNVKDINVTCEHKDPKIKEEPSITGGLNVKNIHDPIYTQLAEDSLAKYKQENGLTQTCHTISKILRVTEQVVAGKITRIDFEARLNCSDYIICHSEIWEQPWISKKEIKVTCRNKN